MSAQFVFQTGYAFRSHLSINRNVRIDGSYPHFRQIAIRIHRFRSEQVRQLGHRVLVLLRAGQRVPWTVRVRSGFPVQVLDEDEQLGIVGEPAQIGRLR